MHVCELSTTSSTCLMIHFNTVDPPPYSEFTKSREAAVSTSGGGQQVGSIPAPVRVHATSGNVCIC